MKYREHPSYSRNKDLLQFYLDSFLGGDNYVSDKHLHQFARETDKRFLQRLKRSYYLNYVYTVVRVYTQYVNGSVARLAPEGSNWKKTFEEKFYKDVTGDGLDLHSFFREVCDKSSVFGMQGVLVDGTNLIKNRPEIATVASDLSNPPVLRSVDATDVVDWSVDSRGNLNWILIRTQIVEDTNPFIPRKTFRGMELWTRVGVIYFKEESKTGEDSEHQSILSTDNDIEYKRVESVSYNYKGKVPFVWVRNSKTLLDGVPSSMIKDISQVNKAIYNYTSLRDNILYHQTFSVLAIPASNEEGHDYERVIGDNNYLEFDGSTANPPMYLTPPANPAEVLSKVIRECVEEIFRLAVLQKSGTDKNTEYSTAYGIMVSEQDTESALSEKAELMESAEYEVSSLYNIVRGDSSGSLYWIPSYPKKFDVKQLSQDLAEAIQEDLVGMGEAYMIEKKKRIARKSMPELETKDMDAIDRGIEEATKLMEELKDPEVSGVMKKDKGTGDESPDNHHSKTSEPTGNQ